MPDTIPGTTPVKDERPQPRGVLPKNAQAGLMVALAIGMLAIIVLTGRSQPPSAPSASGPSAPVAAPDADRLREYQERLRLLTEQARRQSAAPPPNPAAPPMPADAHVASDPLEGEKRRLDYESLFARVVIPGGSGHMASPRALLDQQPSAGRAGVDGIAPGVPTLDAIADAALRASQRQQPSPTAPVDSAGQQRAQTDDTLGRSRTAGSEEGYVLYEGTLISATLQNRLDGSTAGPVKCLVNSPVYSRKDRQLLIPPGAVVLGKSTPVQLMGESRIAVSFHRLLMPDDRSYSLDHFTGLNQLGDAGLRDRVNQHYLSTFGAAAAIGLLTGLSQAIGTAGLTGGDGDRTIVIAGTTGETTQATTRVLDRMLNRPPTVTIREGHRVVVYVTSDLHLPAYAWPGTP